MIIKPYVEPNSQSLTGASAKMASVQSCSLPQLSLQVRFGTESPKSSNTIVNFSQNARLKQLTQFIFFQLIADKLYAND